MKSIEVPFISLDKNSRANKVQNLKLYQTQENPFES